jgi:hypothetical protein
LENLNGERASKKTGGQKRMNTSPDFLTSLTGAVAVVPIIIALVQVIKMSFPKLDNRYAPILSIAIGIVVAFLLKHDTANLTNVILEGVLYGLSASGLYSGVTTMKSDTSQNASNGQASPSKTSGGQNTQEVKTTETTTTQQATTTNNNTRAD